MKINLESERISSELLNGYHRNMHLYENLLYFCKVKLI